MDASFEIFDIKEHIKTKGMWAGLTTPTTIPNMLGLNETAENIIKITNSHTSALLKIFDEVIVNASDHAKGVNITPKVTTIDINFSIVNGDFSVRNNGAGIPIIIHDQASKKYGHPVYFPEIAFSIPLAGTNMKKSEDNIKGGINGLGAKIANIHSTIFCVSTLDKSKKLYTQKWENGTSTRYDPVIIPDQKTEQFTHVQFTPNYSSLGYTNNALFKDLDNWIRLRAHQTAAYLGKNITVNYNGERCQTVDAQNLGKLLFREDEITILPAKLQSKTRPHIWDVAIVVLPATMKAARDFHDMGIVNGVITNKGPHMVLIKQYLTTAVESFVSKITKDHKGKLLNGVYIVMCGAIPGADWSGQRKDVLEIHSDKIADWHFTDTFLKHVASVIADRTLRATTKKTKVVHEKYIKAKFAGVKGKKQYTLLLAAEGDSAISLLRSGLTQIKGNNNAIGTAPSFDWCGIISLQGVILNAAREVKICNTNGGEIEIKTEKLKSNKRLLALADAFGLDYDKKYETQSEMDTLNYGQLILCVDQDLDGTGKIAALVLVWINLFWPALIKNGKIGRFMTPLIRVKLAQSQILEFYYEPEFIKWQATQASQVARRQIVKYYKGLATHDASEVKTMFLPEAFKNSTYTYSVDDSTAELFKIYFDADSKPRKKILREPVEYLTIDEITKLKSERNIPVGRVQLNIDTKAYKNDAIKRQLAGICDGLNPARRKILTGAMIRFAGEAASKELKVFQLGGAVADKVFYHHGDASLNATIIYLAQSFPGARRFPLLTGVGQFGSRHGDKSGSPRYISVKLSPLINIIYPPADKWHLEYVFEDGERAEPQYFVPIVPMGILESYRIVSEGWNHISYARDLGAVLDILNALLSGDEELNKATQYPFVSAVKWPLPPSNHRFAGSFSKYKGKLYSFGVYSWNQTTRTLTISELPLGVSTSKYIKTISEPRKNGTPNPKMDYIEEINDYSSIDNVNLTIKLKSGAIDLISNKFGDDEIDPIQDAFMLRASMQSHLNYYGTDGSVIEYGENYLTALLHWASLRRELYIKRVTREVIITEMRILEESEIIRYIELSAELNLAEVESDAAAEEVLRQREFKPLNSTLLHNPQYTPNEKLREMINLGASFNYILNLRSRDLVKTAVQKRKDNISALEKKLIIAKGYLDERPIACATLWRNEIKAFCAAI